MGSNRLNYQINLAFHFVDMILPLWRSLVGQKASKDDQGVTEEAFDWVSSMFGIRIWSMWQALMTTFTLKFSVSGRWQGGHWGWPPRKFLRCHRGYGWICSLHMIELNGIHSFPGGCWNRLCSRMVNRAWGLALSTWGLRGWWSYTVLWRRIST